MAENKQIQPEHIEDLVYDGHDGVGLADQHLRYMNNYLLGAKRNTPKRVETNVDGGPSFHIFKDYEGRIGVGTDKLFDKKPKMNFTEEEIDYNHGDEPETATVLKQVLRHAHKMVPYDMKPSEMYKGNFLFGDGSSGRPVNSNEKYQEFHPNTLKYKVSNDTPEAGRIALAKVGVSLHTHIKPDGTMEPIDKKRRAKLMDHPDVYNYDPLVSVDPVNNNPMIQRQFEDHMENARKSYSKIKPEVYDSIVGHDQNMRDFTNQRILAQADGPGNVKDYLDFMNQKAQNDIITSRSKESKERKTKQYAALNQKIIQNAKHVQNIFDLHYHLQSAKNVLVDVADRNSKEIVELPDGALTGHKGYTSTIKMNGGEHQAIFKNRNKFSLVNFNESHTIKESLSAYLRNKFFTEYRN